MNKKGFSLVEAILYVALVSIIVSAAVIFAWDIIFTNAKSSTYQSLSGALRFASDRISLEVRNSSGISAVSTSSITLSSQDSSRDPTVIDLDSGQIRVGQGASGTCTVSTPCPLTPQGVTVTNLSFTDLSNSNSQNVHFTITGEIVGSGSQYTVNQTLTTSSEVRAN